MGTYEIPRDTKGEGRLFYIFSKKALVFTVGGILLGWILRWIIKLFGTLIPPISGVTSVIGMIVLIVFALLGFAIGTFKVPQIDRFAITRQAAGLRIDQVLWDSIKYHFSSTKLYVYDTKELVKEEIIKDEEERKEIEEKEQKARDEKNLQNAKNRRGYIIDGR